jgi:hypothetical protein
MHTTYMAKKCFSAEEAVCRKLFLLENYTTRLGLGLGLGFGVYETKYEAAILLCYF